jgi:hypothetical protein
LWLKEKVHGELCVFAPVRKKLLSNDFTVDSKNEAKELCWDLPFQ